MKHIVDLAQYRTLEITADSEDAMEKVIIEGGYYADGWQLAEIVEIPEGQSGSWLVDLAKYRSLDIEADSHADVLLKVAEGGYNNDGWQVAEIYEVPLT